MADAGPQRRLTRRLLLEITVLSVLALHLGLYYLFSLPAQAPAPPESGTPETVILSPEGREYRWEAELRTWAYLGDPTLFSLPHPKLGFSAALGEVALPPYTDPQSTPTPLAGFPAPAIAGLELPIAAAPLGQVISSRWPETAAAPPAAVLPVTVPATLLWRFADGFLLKGLPESLPPDMLKTLGDLKPGAPSRFEVVLKPAVPARLTLLSSCGNTALDQFALKALARKLTEWERLRLRQQSSPEMDRITAAPDAALPVEVEWRLVNLIPQG